MVASQDGKTHLIEQYHIKWSPGKHQHLGILKKFKLYLFYNDYETLVIQLTLIMRVGTDACLWMVFMWEETGVPRGNPPV